VAGANVQGNAVVAPGDPNAWRYQQRNGQWWYYTPNNQWMTYNDGAWTTYGPGPAAPGAQQ
jgi:hypothetical protein